MVQSPSSEANWFAASQEIPRISRNPKVHYRIHKRPPPVSILGQPNPVHIPTSHLLEIQPNIIHPSTPRSPQWSPSLRFPHQDPINPLSSPIRATCPAHFILLDFITRTILGEEYRSLSSSLCSLLHSPVTLSLLGWKAISITYSDCVFVALPLRRIILSSVVCLDVQYFSAFYQEARDFRDKKLLNIKCVFFLQLLSEIFVILRRTDRNIIINVYRYSWKVRIIRVRI